MNARTSQRSLSYEATRAYIASEHGRAAQDRLVALGASWSPRAKPHAIVEALGRMQAAPPLPLLPTFKDKAAFLCGVCWATNLVTNLSRHMEE